MSIDLNSLLSSELVLLLVGSLIIPTVFGIYAWADRRIQDNHKKQLLTRIIIYRLDLIDDACSHFHFKEAVDVINGNSEENCYTPMMKENEDNMNIFGLIMSALNDDQLKRKAIPESISNLINLKNLLNKMTTNTPKNNGETNEEKVSMYDTEDIKKLVIILNELILIKENFKENLFRQNFLEYVADNYRDRKYESRVNRISSDKNPFVTKFGNIKAPKISSTLPNTRSGYHFDLKSKFYFDKENGFIITFPPENWFGSNQILFRCLKEKNDQNKVCFVLVRRNVPDFYIENFNVAIIEGKMENNEFEKNICLDKYLNELKKKYENKGFEWGQIIKKEYDKECDKKWDKKWDKNSEKKCKSVTFEIYPLKFKDKKYYMVKRLIRNVRKIYILTATFDEQNLEYVNKDVEKIFNDFVLIDD